MMVKEWLSTGSGGKLIFRFEERQHAELFSSSKNVYYSHLVWYFGFCLTKEDQIHNGANLHVACPILSTPFLLIPWRLKEPERQEAWYWPPRPEYSVCKIRRANVLCLIHAFSFFQTIVHPWLRSMRSLCLEIGLIWPDVATVNT